MTVTLAFPGHAGLAREPLGELCRGVGRAKRRLELVDRRSERPRSFVARAGREERPPEHEVGKPQVARMRTRRDHGSVEVDGALSIGARALEFTGAELHL